MTNEGAFRGDVCIAMFQVNDEGPHLYKRPSTADEVMALWLAGCRAWIASFNYTHDEDGNPKRGNRLTRSITNMWTEGGDVYVQRRGTEFWRLHDFSIEAAREAARSRHEDPRAPRHPAPTRPRLGAGSGHEEEAT